MSESATQSILSVSDDPQVHRLVTAALEGRGLGRSEPASWRETEEWMREGHLPGYTGGLAILHVDGVESLRMAERMLERLDRAQLLLLGDREMADQLGGLVERGARDYLTRPFSLADLGDRLDLAIGGASSPGPGEDLELIGRSKAFRAVMEQIRLVAEKDASVLITGETGVGKECVARALHTLSHRRSGELVTVNCAGIPATLLEDEFFGHERGAFTDAHRARPGRFEQADGGTIFLDEIGDLPIELQPKLLRVLQEREVHRLGGLTPVEVDTRVVAATNLNLEDAVRAGRFRQDLFYRVNVFPIHIPALRERREDIPLFVAHFLDRFCRRERMAAKTLDRAAEAELMTRSWPGNIRELENAVEIAAIRSQTRTLLTPADFPSARGAGPGVLSAEVDGSSTVNLRQAVLRFEYELIQRALEHAGGNKTQAAEALTLKRTTLIEKMRKLDRELSPER